MIGTHFHELMAAGFTREEAFQLALEMQTSVLQGDGTED